MPLCIHRWGGLRAPLRVLVSIALGVSGFAAVARAAGAAAPEAAPAKLTIDQAVDEALRNNRARIAERLTLTIAEAAAITARLRPTPVFTFSGDHLDLLGTGFSASNNGGPPEIAWRVDVPFERAHKRELRIETAGF